MKPRIHFTGLFLLIIHLMNIESLPRHEKVDTNPGHHNKLLNDFSDDVVSEIDKFYELNFHRKLLK